MRMIWNFEWLHNRKMFWRLLAIMPLYFIWMSNSMPGTRMFLFITALMCSFLPFTLLLREDKFKAQALICSLPVQRRQVIRLRYGTLWLVAVIFFIIMLAVVFLSPLSRVDGTVLLSVAGLFYFLCLSTVIIAVLYPFSVYFGAMGFIIVIVAFQFLGVGLQALILALGHGPDLMSIPRTIVTFLHASHAALGGPLYYSALFIAVVLLNAVSLFISMRLFEKKEL